MRIGHANNATNQCVHLPYGTLSWVNPRFCRLVFSTMFLLLLALHSRKNESWLELWLKKVACTGVFLHVFCPTTEHTFVPYYRRLSTSALPFMKVATSLYHPNGDGGVKLVNHTIAQMLAMLANETQDDWDVHLPHVAFACH